MDENKEIIEEEVKVEETETIEDEPKVEEEVQEAAEITEEADEEKKEDVEEPTEGVESDESGKEEKPEDSEPTEPEETVEEIVEEVVEVPQETVENIDEVKRELEELKFDKEETKAVEDYKSLMVKSNDEMERFNAVIKQALLDGLKHFGIDSTKSIEELRTIDPTKAVMAEQLVQAAQDRIEQKRAELEQGMVNAENSLIFNRAEREIKKYGLTPEQETEAATTFVNIMCEVGINDLKEDLKAKVKLAVAQAKMDIPVDVQKAVEEVKTDTSVLETPTVEIEEKPKEEVEEKPVEPPTPKEEVDMDAFTESATEGKATGVASVNVENVLEKMAALPFRERTAFYREHVDLINEAMSKRRR